MQIVYHLILLVTGIIGGFFGSVVGSAGLISFPVLILIGLPLHFVVATSRLAAFILESVSAFRFYKEGKLDSVLLYRGFILGIAGAIGAVIGARIILVINDQALRLLFGLVILTMALLLFTKKHWGLEEKKGRQRYFIFLFLSTLFVGIYGGFFGFTFGTLLSFVLVTFGYTLLQSAAVGRVIGVITTLAATFVFAAHDLIDYSYALALGIGFGIGGWMGAGIGAKKGSGYIKVLLIIVTMSSCFKLLFDYFSN